MQKLQKLWRGISYISTKFNDRDFVHHTRLDNGIEFASQRRFLDRKLRFQITVNTGSLDNPEGKNGLAHFLEHVLYKAAVSNEFKARGGNINAVTDGLAISVEGYLDNTSENAAYLCNLLQDVLTAQIDPVDYVREQQRILNEINIYSDVAGSVHSSLLKKAFNNTSLFFDVLGTAAHVKAITIEDLEQFKRKWFVGSNIMLVMTGVSDHAGMQKMLSAALKDVPAGPTPPHRIAEFTPVEHREDNPQVHQLYVGIGYPVPPVDMRQELVSDMAESCVNHMLHHHFLATTGLVYHTSARHFAFPKISGIFLIRANMLPESAADFMPDLAKILATASRNLESAVFAQVKKQTTEDIEKRQDYAPIAMHFLWDLHHDLINYGRSVPVDEYLKLARSITCEEVQACIAAILKNEPALIAYGNSEKLHRRNEFSQMLRNAQGRNACPADNHQLDTLR